MQPDMRHLPASGALASCRRTSLSTPQQTGKQEIIKVFQIEEIKRRLREKLLLLQDL